MPYCVCECWFVVHRGNIFGFCDTNTGHRAFHVLIFAFMFSCSHKVYHRRCVPVSYLSPLFQVDHGGMAAFRVFQ